MPTYIGENKIVDRYLGDKFLEAAYIGDEKVYDPYTEITGYLPMIYKSRAAVALKNYRIYGTAEGAGIATENGEPEGYKIPLTVTGINEFDKTATNPDKGYMGGRYLTGNNTTIENAAWAVSEYIAVSPNTEYIWQWRERSSKVAKPSLAIYDMNYATLSTVKYGDFAPNANRIPFTTGANAAFVRLSYEKSSVDEATLYKTSATPIYIGTTKLLADEYIDYVEQKIYKEKPNLVTAEMLGTWVNAQAVFSTNASSLNTAITPIEEGKKYTVVKAKNGNMFNGFFESYPEIGASTYDNKQLLFSEDYYTFTAPIDGYFVSSFFLDYTDTPVVYEGEYPRVAPTDPPVPLPVITVYKGENVLSGIETVGEVKGRIKELYKKLEYLKSTGTQIITTDIPLDYTKKVEADLQLGALIHSTSSNDYRMIFGVADTSCQYRIYNYGGGNPGQTSTTSEAVFYVGFVWSQGITEPIINNADVSKRVIVRAGRPTSYWDAKTVIVNQTVTTTGSANTAIFGAWTPSSGTKYPYGHRDMTLYSFKVYDANDVLLNNLIPVERDNGELGLLDTITNKFYANTGTGTFEKGEYI